jgi:RND family efflux transporter MFP subunit
MKSWHPTLVLKIIGLAMLANLNACTEKGTNHEVAAAIKFSAMDLSQLKTYTLTVAKTPQEVKFDGIIEALNQATVSAQISGRVIELPVDVGDLVNKGELIVRLTDAEPKARVAGAQAKYNEAKAQYARMQDMLTKNLIAKADFDKAESAFKLADANLKEANESLNNTAIYAPYAGIVVNRAIKVGETVSPGTPLLTGLSLEQLRAKVDIPQHYIGLVRKFKSAKLLVADGESILISEMRIPPSADPHSHSFQVLVDLPSRDYSLLPYELFPGTLVKIAFVIGEEQQLLVPAQAIAHRGEVTGIYVINNGLSFRLVRLGTKTSDNFYPVLAGLNVGEQIALDPIAAANVYKQLGATPNSDNPATNDRK